jgi:hypothetical protein
VAERYQRAIEEGTCWLMALIGSAMRTLPICVLIHGWNFPCIPGRSLASRAPLIVQPFGRKWLLGETINQSMGCAADINYFGLLENSIDVPPIELFHERVSHLQLNENIQIVL